jgi:hypothetical protein
LETVSVLNIVLTTATNPAIDGLPISARREAIRIQGFYGELREADGFG